jgi:hypothetical protein
MLLGISSSNININTLKMVLLLVHFVDGDIISDFGLGSWWGPSGAILVRSIEDSTKTVLSIRIEPWWEEGALPVLGLKVIVLIDTINNRYLHRQGIGFISFEFM